MTTRSASSAETAPDTTATSMSSNNKSAAEKATIAADKARERAAGAAVGVMSGVRDAAGTVAERLPEAAAATRATVDQATRRMEAGSDEMLIVGASMSFGFAAGLLVGGAPRMLVTAALVPAVAMTMTLLDRSGRMGGRTRPVA